MCGVFHFLLLVLLSLYFFCTNCFHHPSLHFYIYVFARTPPSQFLLIEILTIFQSPFKRLCISPLHRVGRLEPIPIQTLCRTSPLEAYTAMLCPNPPSLVGKDYFCVQLIYLIPCVEAADTFATAPDNLNLLPATSILVFQVSLPCCAPLTIPHHLSCFSLSQCSFFCNLTVPSSLHL